MHYVGMVNVIIEIKGVNFVNKGAELMLQATLQQVSSWNNESVVVALDLRSGSFHQRHGLGLAHLGWIDSKKLFFVGPALDFALALLPGVLRNKWNFVRRSDSTIIFDAAGFAHSDQFGPTYSEILLKYYKHAKKAGKKIVLLPQAFGPFSNKRIAAAVSQIVQLADLVYARDLVSYEHLVRLNGHLSHIKTAPDFTNLVKGNLVYNEMANSQPCIIPNNRMLEKTESAIRENYVDFLVMIIKHLQEKNLKPFLLIHETQSDYPLSQTIQAKLISPIPLIQEFDSLKIKGIIGQSSLLISSRYHGLVNGLSQGVPSLATGWSHKYKMLMEDYGCPEYLVSPSMPQSETITLLDSMLEEPTRNQLVEKLNKAGGRLETSVHEMWNEIKTLIL